MFRSLEKQCCVAVNTLVCLINSDPVSCPSTLSCSMGKCSFHNIFIDSKFKRGEETHFIKYERSPFLQHTLNTNFLVLGVLRLEPARPCTERLMYVI